ncbi:MAG: lipoyl(octanoyl) transferase LipB [Saprospiraceae bacterium]
MAKQQVEFQDLGVIDYKKAWDYQQTLQQELVQRKVALRESEQPSPNIIKKHYLIFCEHPPVYTLGKSGDMQNLLLSEGELKDKHIDFYNINRGGDITFHGLQQIVGYPIFDLEYFFTDVHLYVRNLEEAIIRTIAEFGLKGERIKEYTGVWLAPDNNNSQWRKICAIGVHVSRWVTLHGFAFNVNTDLSYFKNIIPCGINDSSKNVTSLANELNVKMDFANIQQRLKQHLSDIFLFDYQ